MESLVDTHCHIQFADYPVETAKVLDSAHAAGVGQMLCVGCTLEDSRAAVDFAERYGEVYATIGLHPHEAKEYVHNHAALQAFRDLATKQKVVAVGEIGLDYHYNHSPHEDQEKMLRWQIELGLEHNLPFIFHVREAFPEFWNIVDEYKGVRGVIHSFSATPKELEQALQRGLYIGLNGIMTFTKDHQQLEAAKAVPNDRLLLETDAPLLTPTPFRGTICEPKHVRQTAEFLAELRGQKVEELADYTTKNSKALFNLV